MRDVAERGAATMNEKREPSAMTSRSSRSRRAHSERGSSRTQVFESPARAATCGSCASRRGSPMRTCSASSTRLRAPPREARRGAVPRRRRVQLDLRDPQRLLQDQRDARRRPRAGHRLPHGGRAARHGRHRPGRYHGTRSRSRTARSASCPSRSSRRSGARSRRCSATCMRALARDRARPRRHDAARLDARRGAPRRLPAQPLAALYLRAATRRPTSTCA